MRFRNALSAILVLAAACDVTGPPFVTAVSGAAPNPALLDDEITITVSVGNMSDRTIALPSPESAGCSRYFDIVDPAGRIAEIPARFCVASLSPPIDVRPGEVVTYVDTWTPASSTIAGAPIAPGLYEVRPTNLGDVRYGSRSSAVLELQP